MLLNPPTAPETIGHSKRLMYLHKCPYASAGRASYQMSCFMRSLFHQTTTRTSSIVRYGIKLPPSCSDTRDTTQLRLWLVILHSDTHTHTLPRVYDCNTTCEMKNTQYRAIPSLSSLSKSGLSIVHRASQFIGDRVSKLRSTF